jgi:hypothetical protein
MCCSCGTDLYATNKEVLLEGQALLEQIDVWVSYGTIEPGVASVLLMCC